MDKNNVTQEIYPDEDYRQDPNDGTPLGLHIPSGPPLLYVDSLPVREVAADETIMYTIPILSEGNTVGTIVHPTKILSECGNNMRRKVLFNCAQGTLVYLFSSGETTQIINTGLLHIANGFRLPAQIFYEYYGAAEVWAASFTAVGTYAFISVAIDSYYPEVES